MTRTTTKGNWKMWTPRAHLGTCRWFVHYRSVALVAFLGLCLFANPGLGWSTGDTVVAQSSNPKPHEQPYALIFGTVWGPDNRPVYGVKVRIRRESEKKARWEQYSDHNGEFAQRVPVGPQDYVIWADLKGYKSLQGNQLHPDEVKVHIDGEERADTGLHLN